MQTCTTKGVNIKRTCFQLFCVVPLLCIFYDHRVLVQVLAPVCITMMAWSLLKKILPCWKNLDCVKHSADMLASGALISTRAKGPEKKETTRVCYLYIKEAKWPILVVRTLKKQMTIKGQMVSGALEQNGPGSSVKSLTCEFKAGDGPLDLTHQTKALFILKQNVGIVRFESEQHLQKKKKRYWWDAWSHLLEKNLSFTPFNAVFDVWMMHSCVSCRVMFI